MPDAEAIKGAKFLSGRPCKRGHLSERLVSTHACCACSAEANRDRYLAQRTTVIANVHAYRAANPEKVKATRASYAAANSEVIRERDKQRFVGERRERLIAKLAAWSAANPEREKQRVQEWAKANPGKRAASSAKRRAAKLRATPAWADHDLMSAYYELARIYRDFGHEVEVDHIVPLQGEMVCGLHVHDNLQIIPLVTNRAKSNIFAH